MHVTPNSFTATRSTPTCAQELVSAQGPAAVQSWETTDASVLLPRPRPLPLTPSTPGSAGTPAPPPAARGEKCSVINHSWTRESQLKSPRPNAKARRGISLTTAPSVPRLGGIPTRAVGARFPFTATQAFA